MRTVSNVKAFYRKMKPGISFADFSALFSIEAAKNAAQRAGKLQSLQTVLSKNVSFAGAQCIRFL